MKEFIKKFIPSFLLGWYHWKLAFWGAVLYGFPSKKIKVIGITGTNGKSTTAEMTAKILEQAGYKTSVLSSIRFKIGEKEWPNMLKMTMPGRFRIQKFLRQAVNSGCQYAVLEVTSEGIKQRRHKFVDFEAAVFTNLTPEHIEAHAGFENYRGAKGKLFQSVKNIHIINVDDENAEYFLQFPANKKLGYSIKGKGISRIEQYHRLVYGTVQNGSQPLTFSVGQVNFKLNLLGKFNISNALAAISVGISQGINLETCKKALERIKGIPGRMEEVVSEPFKVFVDYAFTPNALQKVYETLSENSKFEILNSKQILNSKFKKPKIICVLGACGGGRDKWKRPVLGGIAAKYCDEIIITNEDPYDENPYQILENIEKGILKIKNLKLKIKNYQKILDRREAIKKSLELAKPNDIVIITGKGCEPWICGAGGGKIPWDDREVVREEAEKLKI